MSTTASAIHFLVVFSVVQKWKQFGNFLEIFGGRDEVIVKVQLQYYVLVKPFSMFASLRVISPRLVASTAVRAQLLRSCGSCASRVPANLNCFKVLNV
jgi:hypothetical protein